MLNQNSRNHFEVKFIQVKGTKKGQNCAKLCYLLCQVDHFSRRMWIRETWGQNQPSLFKRKAVYFFLGKSMNQSVNEAVRRENQRYRDIVQAGTVVVI